MFYVLYFFAVVILSAVLPGIYHPCDPELANKAAINFFIGGSLVHVLLIEIARFLGDFKRRRILREIIILFAVMFVLLLLISIVNINPVCLGGNSYSTKNQLINGVKECAVMDVNNQSTNFSDATSFSSEERNKYRNFQIIKTEKNSCFNARAVPTNDQNTWFEIDYDPKTGKISRVCGDSSKSGCEEGNTW